MPLDQSNSVFQAGTIKVWHWSLTHRLPGFVLSVPLISFAAVWSVKGDIDLHQAGELRRRWRMAMVQVVIMLPDLVCTRIDEARPDVPECVLDMQQARLTIL